MKICKYQYVAIKQWRRMSRFTFYLFYFVSKWTLSSPFFSFTRRFQIDFDEKEVFVWRRSSNDFLSLEHLINKKNFFLTFQGHRESRRAEQHLTCNTCPCLHGSSHSRNAATKATTTGTRESRCSGGNRKGRKYGHRRMSTSVQKPAVELLNAKLPTRQKPFRQDRRSWWVHTS